MGSFPSAQPSPVTLVRTSAAARLNVLTVRRGQGLCLHSPPSSTPDTQRVPRGVVSVSARGWIPHPGTRRGVDRETAPCSAGGMRDQVTHEPLFTKFLIQRVDPALLTKARKHPLRRAAPHTTNEQLANASAELERAVWAQTSRGFIYADKACCQVRDPS